MHTKRSGLLRGLLITVCVFAAMILLSNLIITNITRTSREGELDLVKRSVRSAALTCYAVEGAYPDDVSYLKEHYGLYYDESVYTVVYESFASNIFPDIFVMEGGDGQ